VVGIRFWPKTGSGAQYLERKEILKFYLMNILDRSMFSTFGVRCSIDVIDSENQPGSGKIRNGSGAPGLTAEV